MSRRRLVGWLARLVVVLLFLIARSARADVERFALLVGNDRGDANDGPLRYAATDADRMRDVLVQTGGFSAAQLIVLHDESADTVRRALISLNERVRISASRPDTQVVLFVYYSGHADGTALHLGSTRFDLVELEQLVRGSASQFRVLLVDACRSGALARIKGGTDAPPFAVHFGEQLEGQGVAFLTSSAQKEDAQESDELGGSFFTHYFVSGLRGAADFDADGRVQLDEAYRYAYEATVRATSRTWAGTQHPQYRFDLGGQGRLVLTEPQRGSARSVFTFPPGRSYLVFRGAQNGPVIGEVTAQTSARRMFVKPDRYFVRARAPDYALEGELTIADGQTLYVPDDRLKRIDYARLVRKGGADLHKVSGPVAGYTVRTALKQSSSLCNGGFAGYAFTFPFLSVTPRLDMCGSGFENSTLQASVYDVGGDVRLAHNWDLPFVSLDVGLTVGGSWLRQSFTTQGYAPDRDTVALRTSVGLGATFDLPAGFYFLSSGAAETYVFELQDSATKTKSLTASIAVRLHLGIGKHW